MRHLPMRPLYGVAILFALASAACIIEESDESRPADEPSVRIERDDVEEGAFERLGQRLDRGAEKLDERLEVGTERFGRAMEKAGKELQETADEARARRLREEGERAKEGTSIDVHIER